MLKFFKIIFFMIGLQQEKIKIDTKAQNDQID